MFEVTDGGVLSQTQYINGQKNVMKHNQNKKKNCFSLLTESEVFTRISQTETMPLTMRQRSQYGKVEA